jgi:hypothetical protein
LLWRIQSYTFYNKCHHMLSKFLIVIFQFSRLNNTPTYRTHMSRMRHGWQDMLVMYSDCSFVDFNTKKVCFAFPQFGELILKLSINFFKWHKWPRICSGFVIKVTQQVSLVEKELHSLPRHMRSPVFGGIRVARSLVFWVEFCRSLFVLLCFFLLAIVVSVLLRFTDSDWPFGIFKLFCAT